MHKLYNAWFRHPFLKGNQMVNISLQIIICTLVTILKLWTSNIKKQKRVPGQIAIYFLHTLSYILTMNAITYTTFRSGGSE